MTHNELQALCEKMTLDEKIGMVHGAALFKTQAIKRLGIPPFTYSDGPMGVRFEYKDDVWIPKNLSDDSTSYLLSNTALASTFNTSLAYEAGKILGEETRGRGKDMILGPGVNIHRSPLSLEPYGGSIHQRRTGIRRFRLRKAFRFKQPGNPQK